MLFFLTFKREKRQNQKQPKANFSKVRLYKRERSFKIKVSIFRVFKNIGEITKLKKKKERKYSKIVFVK